MELAEAIERLLGWLARETESHGGNEQAITSAWQLAKDAGVTEGGIPADQVVVEAVSQAQSQGHLRLDRTNEGGWPRFIGAWLTITPSGRLIGEQFNREHAEEAAHGAMPLSLSIGRLEIDGFRGIQGLTLELKPDGASVLIGRNGSGKTRVLTAAATLLSHYIARLADTQPTHVETDDVTIGMSECRIALTVNTEAGPVTWSLGHSPSGRRNELRDLERYARGIGTLWGQGRRMSLPVVVLYNVNRAALDIPDRIRKRHDFGQFTAYDGALNRGESNFRLFFEWFRLREDLENEIRLNQSPEFRDSQLDAVRKAIEGLVPGFSNPRVRRAPTQRMTVTKGDQELEISQLSDGEKCLMALVGDLARRLSIAQPQSATPLLGQGVALIDELELHLHPAWQREVVPALTRVFPGVQFILSTHSPQVLSELVADRVLLLEPVNRTIRVAHPSSTYGRDTNRILEDVMNVCDRPARIKEKIDALYLSLADDRFEDAATLLRDLEGTLGADEPELVRAGVLIKRKQATRQP